VPVRSVWKNLNIVESSADRNGAMKIIIFEAVIGKEKNKRFL